MIKLSRNQASIIFEARTRMLKIKDNYKNGNESLKCSICKDKEETQGHILEECENINEIAPNVTKELIFSAEDREKNRYPGKPNKHQSVNPTRKTLRTRNVHNKMK